jgi:hypothetical protein
MLPEKKLCEKFYLFAGTCLPSNDCYLPNTRIGQLHPVADYEWANAAIYAFLESLF